MLSMRPCPICGHNSANILFHPKTSPGPVGRCFQCGMVFISLIKDKSSLIFDGPVGQPAPNILTSSNLEDVKDSWEFNLLPRKELEKPALRKNAIEALRQIKKHLEKPSSGCKIFDFGAGFGYFLSFAKERGWDTFGLEPLPASAIYARATFGLNILTDTLRKDSFPQRFFEVITSFQVFEHLPFPKKDLCHLHGMLQKNGLILIEIPNIDTWSIKLMGAKHRHFVRDHLNFFSTRTLGQLMEDCGFEVLEHFHPARRMSMRHLVSIWGRQYLPRFLYKAVHSSLEKSFLWEKNFALNIGDITTMIGKKI